MPPFLFWIHAMNKPSEFRFQSFGSSDELACLGQTPQVIYLRQYLYGLGVQSLLIEDGYFDRDYLSEFSAFYGQSARGYSNLCKRLSFFTDPGINRAVFEQALKSESSSLEQLKKSFVGFTVLRPFEIAPLGRTVLAWFPEHNQDRRRITKPSRDYPIHLAGIELIVRGLAWQQQDSAVGACATIALWSMFHASAFDDHHAIPTTAEITRSANKKASLGARVFPSKGLNIHQLLEAIKEQGLSPGIIEGNLDCKNISTGFQWLGFSRERFCSGVAALIRSGYPVLLVGHHVKQDGKREVGIPGHAICAVGFRPGINEPVPNGKIAFQETNLEHIYIHDDNVGPCARFEVISHPAQSALKSIVLKHSKPNTAPCHPEISQFPEQAIFVPEKAIVATHNEIRVSPDRLNKAAIVHGENMSLFIEMIRKNIKEEWEGFGVSVNVRYAKLIDYLGDILESTLRGEPERLGKIRLDLCEKVPPMSLHIGIIRFSVGRTSNTFMDILIDSSDNEHFACTSFWAHVAYHPFASILANRLHKSNKLIINYLVEAF